MYGIKTKSKIYGKNIYFYHKLFFWLFESLIEFNKYSLDIYEGGYIFRYIFFSSGFSIKYDNICPLVKLWDLKK